MAFTMQMCERGAKKSHRARNSKDDGGGFLLNLYSVSMFLNVRSFVRSYVLGQRLFRCAGSNFPLNPLLFITQLFEKIGPRNFIRAIRRQPLLIYCLVVGVCEGGREWGGVYGRGVCFSDDTKIYWKFY